MRGREESRKSRLHNFSISKKTSPTVCHTLRRVIQQSIARIAFRGKIGKNRVCENLRNSLSQSTLKRKQQAGYNARRAEIPWKQDSTIDDSERGIVSSLYPNFARIFGERKMALRKLARRLTGIETIDLTTSSEFMYTTTIKPARLLDQSKKVCRTALCSSSSSAEISTYSYPMTLDLSFNAATIHFETVSTSMSHS